MAQPSVGEMFQRALVEAMKLVATLSAYDDQPRVDQHVNVLRDRLP